MKSNENIIHKKKMHTHNIYEIMITYCRCPCRGKLYFLILEFLLISLADREWKKRDKSSWTLTKEKLK